MRLENRKIAILIESDFFENEIFYYQLRFAEEGAEVHFLSRLWGQSGHHLLLATSFGRRSIASETFENMSDEELATFDADHRPIRHRVGSVTIHRGRAANSPRNGIPEACLRQ